MTSLGGRAAKAVLHADPSSKGGHRSRSSFRAEVAFDRFPRLLYPKSGR
jgi:hypothetical protein